MLRQILKQSLYNSLNVEILDINGDRYIRMEQIQLTLVNKNDKLYIFPITSTTNNITQPVQIIDSVSAKTINLSNFVNIDALFVKQKNLIKVANVTVDYRKMNIVQILNLLLKKGFIKIQ